MADEAGRTGPAFDWPRIDHSRIFSSAASAAWAQGSSGVLPSWNDGPAKQAILDFVNATTTQGSPSFVPPEDRIATFDQDGTLWVEHPIYTQAMFALDRVRVLAPAHPEWKTVEPFKAILSGDLATVMHFTEKDWMEIVGATHAGMTTDELAGIAKEWLATAKHPRFKRLCTELVYSQCWRSWITCAPVGSVATS